MRTNNQETKDNVVFGNLHYYDDKLKTYIDKRISEIPSELMQEVTYSELKNLRDNGELIPGLSYRITDYDCMTSEDYTISAKHKFDIIVTADDEHTLNENARAAHHEIKDANITSVNVSMDGTMDEYTLSLNRTIEAYTLGETKNINGSDYYIFYTIRNEMIVNSGGEEYISNFHWSDDEEGIGHENISYASSMTPQSLSEYFVYYNGFMSLQAVFSEELGYLMSYGINVTSQSSSVTNRIDDVNDTYFAKSNLSAWELKYCLDNDGNRFNWMQSTSIRVSFNNDEQNRGVVQKSGIFNNVLNRETLTKEDIATSLRNAIENSPRNKMYGVNEVVLEGGEQTLKMEDFNIIKISSMDDVSKIKDIELQKEIGSIINKIEDFKLGYYKDYLKNDMSADEIIDQRGHDDNLPIEIWINNKEKFSEEDIRKLIYIVDGNTYNVSNFISSVSKTEGARGDLRETVPLYLRYLDEDYDNVSVRETILDCRGVIYYMKDEWGNEAPYDFKNILFSYADYDFYTFSLVDENYNIYDFSIKNEESLSCKNNVIKPYIPFDTECQSLNSNIFVSISMEGYSSYINNNKSEENSCYNLIISDVEYCTLGYGVYYINGDSAVSSNDFVYDYLRFDYDVNKDVLYWGRPVLSSMVEKNMSGDISITPQANCRYNCSDVDRLTIYSTNSEINFEFLINTRSAFAINLPIGSKYMGDINLNAGSSYILTHDDRGIYYIGQLNTI